jgi:hypothetical protein
MIYFLQNHILSCLEHMKPSDSMVILFRFLWISAIIANITVAIA